MKRHAIKQKKSEKEEKNVSRFETTINEFLSFFFVSLACTPYSFWIYLRNHTHSLHSIIIRIKIPLITSIMIGKKISHSLLYIRARDRSDRVERSKQYRNEGREKELLLRRVAFKKKKISLLFFSISLIFLSSFFL